MAKSDPKVKLAVLWILAASGGLLVAAVPAVDGDVSARIIAALLLLVSLPFGYMRPSVPALWAVAIGWPTVIVRLSESAGAGSIALLVYPLVGVYAGDWIGAWQSERQGRAAAASREVHGPRDGAGLAPDGLPPAVPGRGNDARRRAEDEGRRT